MSETVREPHFLSDKYGEFMNTIFAGQKLPLVQVVEMKKAFFAGAIVVFHELLALREGRASREDAAEWLRLLYDEIKAYMNRVRDS